MESTTAARTKTASQANRKTTAMSRQTLGAYPRSTLSTTQSTASGATQISKKIKKTYVRFDDYLDLNEENMRRSCKRLMNRLYKDEANSTNSSALQHGDDKDTDQLRRTGAQTGNVPAPVSTASSVGGRSYLRLQFERRQQRQMAAILKSARQAKQASDEALGAIEIRQPATKETVEVSADARSDRCADIYVTPVTPDTIQAVAGDCVDTAMMSSAANGADAERRQQMIQRRTQQQQQQDSVARSHELSKRRFFEQLERRKSVSTVANATRDTCARCIQGTRRHATEQQCLGHSISGDATSMQDQQPIVATTTSRGNHSNSNNRQVAARRTTGKNGPQEYFCRPSDGNASESKSGSTQLLQQVVGELDNIGDSKQMIAWTHNLSATTNELRVESKIANGSTGYTERDNKRANVFVVASREDLSDALTMDSSPWPNNGDNGAGQNEVQFGPVATRNHFPQEIIAGNYANDSILSDALVCDGPNPCEQLGTQAPITIDACNPNRFKQKVMSTDEKLMMNASSAAADNDDSSVVSVERLTFDNNEQSMFEIKVPAAGECSNQIGGACGGHISELIVKQVAEIDGSAPDQVSSNSIGISEKAVSNNGSGVEFELSWQQRRESNQDQENHQRQPPTSIERQGQSETPKDASSKSERGESTMILAHLIEEVRGDETGSRDQSIVSKRTSMVARADGCINKGNNNNNNNNTDYAENNKCSVEISNHKARAINGINSGVSAQETIESEAMAQSDNQRSDCNSESAFGMMMAAPAVSKCNSSTVNDNQGGGGKKQSSTRATTTDIYDGGDTVTGASRDLRSDGQVNTAVSGTVVEPHQIPEDEDCSAVKATAAETRALSGSNVAPETDVAITKEEEKRSNDVRSSLLGGDFVKMNGPDKVSGAAADHSDEKTTGQLLALVRSYGCSANKDRDNADCNATCSAMMQPQTKITHESAPRDVPLELPEAVDNTCNSGGGKINRLLVRNDGVDVVVKSEQQHEMHDYELHDDGDPDCPKVDCDEDCNGKRQQQLREQVNESKEQEGADLDERRRSMQQLLVGTNGGDTALVSHDQSQWAEPDSSGGTRGSGNGIECFLNDANRLIRPFEMTPADQQVESLTRPAIAMGPTATTTNEDSNQSDRVGAISPGDCNGSRNSRMLQQPPLPEPERMRKPGNAVSSDNNDADYYEARQPKKLCNDTCGGGDKEENSNDAPEKNDDDRSTHGCGAIELLICADSEEPPNQQSGRQVAQVQTPSSSHSSSMSSPAISSGLISLSGTARAGATNAVPSEEDGCCGSSSCSSSGFGASVASTDDSAAPQPSRSATSTCGGSESTPNSSLALVSLPATSSAGSAQIYQSARRRGFALSGMVGSQQSDQLTVAPLYDCLRLRQPGKPISGGGLCPSDGAVAGKRSSTSLLDEFPDYKQISVRPDEAYPKRSGRPLVVVENYGYASVGQQQRPTSVSATCVAGGRGQEQVNPSTTGTTMLREHSYANIPSATEQCSWNNMMQRRTSTATCMNNNGYAIVRNGISRNTLEGSNMSFSPDSCGESSVVSAASERPSAAGTQHTSSSAAESATESSSQSAGFSALPPVRLVDCTSANIFESLPLMLNSNSNGTCRGMTESADCRNLNDQQKTKASLLRRFGSLVSRAFANSTSNNNNIHTDNSMVAKSKKSPRSVSTASSPKTVETRSGELDNNESKESIIAAGNLAVASKHLEDADLVILPPKSKTAPKSTKASNEQLSPRARQRASATDRYHRKSLRHVNLQRVSRQRKTRHYQSDEDSTSSLSSWLCNSSESLYSSANAYHRRLRHRKESPEFGSINANLVGKQVGNKCRKRASSLSEELESLMSRSAADSEEQRLLLTANSPNNKLDRKYSTRSNIKQVYGISGLGNTHGAVIRNESMSVTRKQRRFDIDCDLQQVQQRQQCMGVDCVNTNKNKNTKVVKKPSLRVFRWIGNEPENSSRSSRNTSTKCVTSAPVKPRVESTPNLSKEASVISHLGDSGGSTPPEERDNRSNRAIDSALKYHSRDSKLFAVARQTLDANCDHHHDHEQQIEERSHGLIEQSHAADSNNAKLGRSDRQEQQKSQTEVSNRATCAKRTLKQQHRQPTSLIYSNLLQTACEKSTTGTNARHSLSSDEEDDNDFDSDHESECDCSGGRSSHRCKVCVASLNQEEENGNSNECDSPSLYQILLRNYVKRRHTTAAATSKATRAPASDKTNGCDARNYLSRRNHHHESHSRSSGALRAHRHSHRHRSYRHHHHHHHSHRHHGHQGRSPTDRRFCNSLRPLIGRSVISSRSELLDTNELLIRGTGSATSARTPTTTSGAESGTDYYWSRRMHLRMGAEKQTAAAKQRNKIMTGSCCSDNVIANENGESRQVHVWGQLIKINRSDGSQVVELQRAPGKHWGFFVARGAINNVKGIFISRMHDGHDSHSASDLVGLLSIGDRIIAIDGSPIEPDHDIMRVNHMISKKSKILLKVKPLKG